MNEINAIYVHHIKASLQLEFASCYFLLTGMIGEIN